MQRRFRGIGARKGHRGFSWDSLEGLNSSDGRKQNETADCPEAHAESKHGAPEGGHTELWLQIFRDGGRILARRWRGLERQRAAERVFSFSKAKKAGADMRLPILFRDVCSTKFTEEARWKDISKLSVSDSTCEAAWTAVLLTSSQVSVWMLQRAPVCPFFFLDTFVVNCSACRRAAGRIKRWRGIRVVFLLCKA